MCDLTYDVCSVGWMERMEVVLSTVDSVVFDSIPELPSANFGAPTRSCEQWPCAGSKDVTGGHVFPDD